MIRFFRITDKGSVKKPTPQAVITIFFHCALSALVFHDSPMWGVISMAVGYVFWALILSKPFRVSMCKIFFYTRAGRIIAKPTMGDILWRRSNEQVLQRAKIRVYDGE
jgi:hypothetical protein